MTTVWFSWLSVCLWSVWDWENSHYVHLSQLTVQSFDRHPQEDTNFLMTSITHPWRKSERWAWTKRKHTHKSLYVCVWVWERYWKFKRHLHLSGGFNLCLYTVVVWNPSTNYCKVDKSKFHIQCNHQYSLTSKINQDCCLEYISAAVWVFTQADSSAKYKLKCNTSLHMLFLHNEIIKWNK